MHEEEIDLIVRGKEIPVNVALLLKNSKYFERSLKNMINNPKLETITLHHDTYDLASIAFDTMEVIVVFFKTGALSVSETNFKSLLEAAEILEIFPLRHKCLEFILRDIKVSNCVKRFIIVDSVPAPREDDLFAGVRNFLFNFIVGHFSQLSKLSQIYQQTSYEQFKSFLDSPNLNVGSELEVYDAIAKWVNYYPYDRYYFFTVLLRDQLQWYCLTKKEFNILWDSLPNEQILYECYDYESIVDDLLPKIKEYQELSIAKQFRFWNEKGEKPSRWPKLIVAASYAEKAIEYYDFKTGNWKLLTNKPHPIYGSELCQSNGRLYIIGGVQSKDVYRYDIETGIWEKDFPKLRHYRVAHGVVAHRGKIYVIGGSAKASENFGPGLNEMEVYDPSLEDWELTEPMMDGRSFLGAAIFKDKIYCVAGCLSDGHSSAEVFYLDKDESDLSAWENIESTINKRDSCGLIATASKLYAIGGYDNDNDVYFKSVEVYCPEKNTWSLGPSMSSARRSPAVTCYRGQIWVIGGMNEKQDLRSVEVFNTLTNIWRTIDSKPVELSGWMRCCLIDSPLYLMKGSGSPEIL